MSKTKTTSAPAPKKAAKPLDVEEESQRLLEEIEEQYPPDRCSRAAYRAVLQSLDHDLRNRIMQLNSEIGNED